MLLFLLVLEVLAGPMLPLLEEEELDEDEAMAGGRDLERDLDPTALLEPITGECKDAEPTGDGVCLLLLDVKE